MNETGRFLLKPHSNSRIFMISVLLGEKKNSHEFFQELKISIVFHTLNLKFNPLNH